MNSLQSSNLRSKDKVVERASTSDPLIRDWWIHSITSTLGKVEYSMRAGGAPILFYFIPLSVPHPSSNACLEPTSAKSCGCTHKSVYDQLVYSYIYFSFFYLPIRPNLSHIYPS